MNWFRNLKIGIKLIISFFTAIILLGLVGSVGVIGTNTIHKDLVQAFNIRIPALNYLIQSDRDLQQLLVAERTMIFTDVQSENFKKFRADYNENLNQSSERIQKLQSLSLSPKELQIIESYKTAREEWEALSAQIVKSREEDTSEGRRIAIDLTLSQANQAFEKMRTYLDQLQNIELEILNESQKTADQTFRRTFLIVAILTTISILIVIFILRLINNTVTKPINQMVDRTKELAEGRADLTKRILTKSKDEVGNLADLFNKWIGRIQEIIRNVKKGSTNMLGSIEEIANSSQELASSTNQQAASITETSTTLEEFTSILKQTSENASTANSKIIEFDNQVKNNRELIRNVTSTMAEIEKSSKQINNIMTVINDISFQTNLLALNAAVEAARAGEAGRGFAVVASEVRSLAQKTAESAKTIQEIVTTNLNSTEKGMKLVVETESFFESIMKVLSELSNMVQIIENGSREQSTGMEQINLAVAQLDQVINQNAELVNNFANAGKEMNINAGQLKTLMEQFVTEPTIALTPVKPTSPPPEVKKQKQKPKPKEEPTSNEDFFDNEETDFEEF